MQFGSLAKVIKKDSYSQTSQDGSHVRLGHPSCVYITAQRQYTVGSTKKAYTSEITIFTL